MFDIRTAVRMEWSGERRGPIDLSTGSRRGVTAGLNFAVATVEARLRGWSRSGSGRQGWDVIGAGTWRVQLCVKNITADDAAGIALGERFRKLGRFDGAGLILKLFSSSSVISQ